MALHRRQGATERVCALPALLRGAIAIVSSSVVAPRPISLEERALVVLPTLSTRKEREIEGRRLPDEDDIEAPEQKKKGFHP